MTDIVEAMRIMADEMTEELGFTETANTFYHAIDEIERLRKENAIWRDYCPEIVDVIEAAVSDAK